MSTVFLDTFTGTAGTALTAHAPDTGTGWTAGTASTSPILSAAGRARTATTGAADFVLAGTAAPLASHDHDVECDVVLVSIGSTDSTGVYLRSHADADNAGYELALRITSGTPHVEVKRLTVSSATLATGLAAGVVAHLKIQSRLVGANLVVEFFCSRASDGLFLQTDGTWGSQAPFYTITDPSPLAIGQAGLKLYDYAGDDLGFHADNFAVTTVGAAGPTPGTVSTSAVATTSLTVSTTAATGGTAPYSYQFQRAADSAGTPGTFAPVGPDSAATSFDDTGLAAGTAYWYRCVVTDADSQAATSAAVTVTTLEAPATGFSFTGPSGGVVGVPSAAFTLDPDGSTTGTLTLSDGGAGGTFAPTSLTWSGSAEGKTFTYTPAAAGTATLAPGGSTVPISPASLDYAATVKNFIAFDGDSITYGVRASSGAGTTTGTTYPAMVLRFLGTADWDGANLGVSGQTLADMQADAASQVDPLYDADRPFNVVCVLGGTNDMGLNPGVDAPTAYDRLAAYCQARRSAGWKVVALTVPPANLKSGEFDAIRDTFNGLVRAGWTGFADALADIATDPVFADGGETDPTYFDADQIHPVDPGNALLAGYVAGAIETITRGSGGGTPGEIDDVTAQQIIDAVIAGVLRTPGRPIDTDAAGRVLLQPAQPGVTIPAVAAVASVGDKAGYSLAPTGLDAISVADPGAPANQTTLPRMLVALWRRAFKKSSMTASQIQMYADDNTTVTCTQGVSEDGAVQTMEAAA